MFETLRTSSKTNRQHNIGMVNLLTPPPGGECRQNMKKKRSNHTILQLIEPKDMYGMLNSIVCSSYL